MCSFSFGVKDFNIGLRGDTKQGGRRGEPHRLVETGLKFADWPIHQDHRRALVHAKHAAKFPVKADDIAGTQPERMGQRLPDYADELGRRGVNAFGKFHNGKKFGRAVTVSMLVSGGSLVGGEVTEVKTEEPGKGGK